MSDDDIERVAYAEYRAGRMTREEWSRIAFPPSDDEQGQHAHIWTASLIFVAFELLAIGAAVAMAIGFGRGK